MTQPLQHGDFTELAKNYQHRVGYAESVITNLSRFTQISHNSTIADVGAGTGKLTEDILRWTDADHIFAVEPNKAMREEGARTIQNQRIEWRDGSGEITGLSNASADWLLMGSSFHWVDTTLGLTEFARVLKPNGYFTAIWNPRDIKNNPLHEEIESKIREIVPELKRVSSGSGAFTEQLYEKLISTGVFKDVIYVEAKTIVSMSKERYMGIWHSVNDIQFQAGPDRWNEILMAIETIIQPYNEILIPYKTRSWTCQKCI